MQYSYLVVGPHNVCDFCYFVYFEIKQTKMLMRLLLLYF